ncbi:hypothetical protein [Roseiconus lacunae]|uniref:hypothetical protein n=1 Tax=Roseiconus lacunae TaxID=2605694 RepID=UPI001E5F5768|nr:hypothetical protein [Roseiconus lacunae]MCD0461481.1 hypothetical protein [Roseiconus lacunae]
MIDLIREIKAFTFIRKLPYEFVQPEKPVTRLVVDTERQQGSFDEAQIALIEGQHEEKKNPRILSRRNGA